MVHLIRNTTLMVVGLVFCTSASASTLDPEQVTKSEISSSSPWRPHGSLGVGVFPLLSLQAGMTNGAHSFDYGVGAGDASGPVTFLLTFEDNSFEKGSQYFRYRYTTASGFYAGIGLTDYWQQKTFDSEDVGSRDPDKNCMGCAEDVGYAVFHQIGPELSFGYTSNAVKRGFYFAVDVVSFMKPMGEYGRKRINDEATDKDGETAKRLAGEWLNEQDRKEFLVARALVMSWGGRF